MIASNIMRHTRNRFLFTLSAALLFAGCADSIVSDDDDQPIVPVRAKFSDIEQRVFAVSCATAGCHAGNEPASGLDLSAGRAYAQLVGVTSLNNPSLKRIDPGSSAKSAVIGQLRRTLSPAMPPNGPIAASVIDSIAAWIDAGALNN